MSALRDALLAGEIDVAVHSYKDLPTAPAPGIVVAAVPVREDPRDVLVASGGRVLGELLPGAVESSVTSMPTMRFFAAVCLISDTTSYHIKPPGSGVPVVGIKLGSKPSTSMVR